VAIYIGTSTAMQSIAVCRDLIVPMRDGMHLFANLFRPLAERPYPVIVSVTPYGKGKLPDRLVNFLMRFSGVKFGKASAKPKRGCVSMRSGGFCLRWRVLRHHTQRAKIPYS
jgi:hypothetical protein